ncbi:ATPase [Marinobacterium arenosum]|uniref:ATPase n=1 Tax=Marinobacterium arenosum TaxID=2862496 RepID=UPI001C9874E3|nr:ATPase [Marinobacterium arenosum]MBY4676551.1 ATPase [Marinobacterium arenosum]
MKLETLSDVLQWTGEFHRQLAQHLMSGAKVRQDIKVQWLLEYLAAHERLLQHMLLGFQQQASTNALNTWCCEYLDKQPIQLILALEFSKMSSDQIVAEVLTQHERLIGLYRYLLGKADTESTRELLGQLLELERHEAMRMARDAGRLDEL